MSDSCQNILYAQVIVKVSRLSGENRKLPEAVKQVSAYFFAASDGECAAIGGNDRIAGQSAIRHNLRLYR